MRKIISMLAILFAVFAAIPGNAVAQARVYVNVRPAYAPVARPVAPGRSYIWVDEDWAYRGGRYVPVGGHWVRPPHPGYIWVPGRWVRERRGYYWVAGYWRRR